MSVSNKKNKVIGVKKAKSILKKEDPQEKKEKA